MKEDTRQKMRNHLAVAGGVFAAFTILQVASRITALMSSVLLLAPYHMAFLYSGSEVLLRSAVVPRMTMTLLTFLLALVVCNVLCWFVPWVRGKKRLVAAHALYFLVIHVPVGIWMAFQMVPETAH